MRINTLWFLPFYMLLEWKYLRISWRKLFLAGTCSLALYAFIVNPSGLFVDTLGMQKSLNPTHLLFDILNMFYNKTEYLSFYFDEQLKERVLSSIWAKLEFNFLGTLKLLTLLIIIFRKKVINICIRGIYWSPVISNDKIIIIDPNNLPVNS